MDEFEKIKTFSESLAERQQNMEEKKEDADQPDLPQYLSQFRVVQPEETRESKRLLWIMLILCGLITVGIGIILSYRIPKMEDSEIVVIAPTPLPVKVLPENPGGLNIPDKDKVVYNRAAELAAAPVAENLFPEPEQPLLPEDVIEPEIKEESLVSLLQEEESEEIPVIEETQMDENQTQELPEENDIPVVAPIEVALDVPVVAVPPHKPKAITGEVESVKVEEETTVSSGGEWHAQLLSSANKTKVESSWKTISKTHAALLSNMPYRIVSATIPGKGTFWRLQVGEFTTKEMVVNLCAKLKKKKQECIPVSDKK